jgi:hypothetical protein
MMMLLLVAAGFASAQSTQSAPPAPQQQPPATVPAPPGPQPTIPSAPKTFEEIKQGWLAEIEKRIADLRKVAACVQAATGPEQMRACRLTHEPVRRRP